MKHLMIGLMAAALTTAAFGKEATMTTERRYANEGCMRDWTPIALTIAGPVGLPWGFWDVKGLQLGIINYTYQFSGLQIGGINVAERAYGMQIGFVNVISADDCPFLPIINWSF